jgi:cell division transport system ATP-binding protein
MLETIMPQEPVIHFQRLSLVYPNLVRALEDVELEINEGEFCFLVGPTGCGKSSLMRCVYMSERPSKGHLRVLGRDITDLPPSRVPHLRRRLGVVFQDFQLLEYKTVAENVAFALQVIGAPVADIRRKVPLSLRMVGLEKKAKMRPDELSGGEQQRVAIARAIINAPPILLCDEPTGNLDPDTSRDIVRLLTLINQRGTTVIMATHDAQIVNSFKRRVVYIEDGRVMWDRDQGEYKIDDEKLRLLS